MSLFSAGSISLDSTFKQLGSSTPLIIAKYKSKHGNEKYFSSHFRARLPSKFRKIGSMSTKIFWGKAQNLCQKRGILC
jgi:hypothetical protein